MSSRPVDHLHPVADFAQRLSSRLDSVAEVPVWSMPPEQQRAALLAADHDAKALRIMGGRIFEVIAPDLAGPARRRVGRRRRLHSEPMRLAMGVRDGGCTAVGCETPPGMCHAHHDASWSVGGSTNLVTGRLLCPQHHRRVHDPRHETRHLPGGRVSFHRRT